jgi:L-alanine-DL-glutamate epimerase-like enolase superfamily enzyme
MLSAEIIPLPPVDWGNGDLRDIVLLELTGMDGMTGLGSAYTGVKNLQEALALYKKDPGSLNTTDARITMAMSAIDIALWDIRGKAENLPVSELIGGRRHDRVMAYATLGLPMTSASAGDAFEITLRSVLDQGFRAVKLCIEDFGHRDSSKTDKEWDICEARLLAFARKIAGTKVQLMLDVCSSDPYWSGNFEWALKTANVLDDLEFSWFEEPLAPDAIDEFAKLTRMSNITITGAEDFILLRDFESLADRRAMNILQPDCTRVGGLTQMLAIRKAAEKNNMHLIPHGWNSAIGLAADLQLQATSQDQQFCMVEVRPHRIITGILQDAPFALDDEGKIRVPTGPGLGVSLKEEIRHGSSSLAKLLSQ